MLSSPSTLVELQLPPPFPPYHRQQTGIIFVRYPNSQWKEKESLGKL